MLQDVWQAIDERRYEQAEEMLKADQKLLPTRAGQMALGYLLAHTRRAEAAREVFGNLRQQHLGDEWEHIAVHQLGRVERLDGQYAAALQLFAQEKELIVRHGADAHALAVNHLEAAQCHLALGQLAEARRELEAGLEQARAHDDPETLGRTERGLAELSEREGRPEASKAHYQQALAAFRESEDHQAVTEIEMVLAGLEFV